MRLRHQNRAMRAGRRSPTAGGEMSNAYERRGAQLNMESLNKDLDTFPAVTRYGLSSTKRMVTRDAMDRWIRSMEE
nr:MAG TPA: hypothetical protein [Caudoviricetes sp.]